MEKKLDQRQRNSVGNIWREMEELDKIETQEGRTNEANNTLNGGFLTILCC